jgi:zinc D-Ala-D-Ala carboxypeptidase
MIANIWSKLKQAFGWMRSSSLTAPAESGPDETPTDCSPDSCEKPTSHDGDAEQPTEPSGAPSGTTGTTNHGTQSMTSDWRWASFTREEMRCKHSGKNGMRPETMDRLQNLRTSYGKPMKITSGYRDATHPIEAGKATPGAHASGQAVDIAVGPGEDVYELVRLALFHGFTGIGISQRTGQPRFVHLDDLPRKAVWSY